MEFGEKMKELISIKGLSQKQFALQIEMDYSHANKFFTGRKPNMEFISKVLKVFPNVDLNWLLTEQREDNNIMLVQEPNTPYIPKEVTTYIQNIEENMNKLKSVLTQI